MEEMHAIEHVEIARHVMIETCEGIHYSYRKRRYYGIGRCNRQRDRRNEMSASSMFNVINIRTGIGDDGNYCICCNALKQVLVEFHNFRKSKTLHQLIVEVNQLEEEGDKLTEATRDLCVNCNDFKEIAVWDITFTIWKMLRCL